MKIIKCIHTQNDCYKENVRLNSNVKQTGIVIHSTGANNKNLKRYVQPSNDDPNRAELLKLIGTNTSNSWNRSGVQKATHYFLGNLADGSLGVAQILPENYYCWGCGKGSRGSYNYEPNARIQFEMCEDSLTDANYFNSMMTTAQELCADICLRYDWNADAIVSHREAHARGYASNHGDCDNWLSWFGKNMNWFRAQVQAILDEARKPVEPVEPVTPYTPKVGEIVEYVGTVHYRSANATTAYSCRPGLATVSRTYNGKHPYHLINTNNDSAYVYGWVDAEFIRKYDAPVVEEKPKEEVKEEEVKEEVEKEPEVTTPVIPDPPVVDEPEIKEPVIEPETPVVPDKPEIKDPPVVNTPVEDPVIDNTTDVVEPEDPATPDVVDPQPQPTPEPKKNFIKQLLEFIVDLIKKIFSKK